MSYDYCPYICDTETTSLDLIAGDIIELSIIRYTTGEQKTWFIKAVNIEGIDSTSLKINGHKYEDITWKTKEGKEKYLEPSKALVEIENWIEEDNLPAEKRIFVAFNVGFDYPRLQLLWNKNNSSDSFPFGRRSVDPMSIAFFHDWATQNLAEGYSLANLVKKYKLKNEKAHSAEADTKVTSDVFTCQLNEFKNLATKGNLNLIDENIKLKNKIKHVLDFIESSNSNNSDIEIIRKLISD